MTASIPETIPDTDFWVFGYGSLIWNPGFPYVEQHTATVQGYHRAFCLVSVAYRGTTECPGLVLGLDHGGECTGMIFRVSAADSAQVMEYLYDREMMRDSYHPTWIDVVDKEGNSRSALTFVINQNGPDYSPNLPMDKTAQMIAHAHGTRGPNYEYLLNTVSHLHELDICPGNLTELLTQVKEIRG